MPVRVKVEHGTVTLTGDVDWAFQRAEAEHDMRKLGGVRVVINDIHVRPQVQVTDVHAQIRGAFERAAELDASHVTVEVKDGKVFLGGRVTSWIEREEAERAAWSIQGVVGVEDNILIARP